MLGDQVEWVRIRKGGDGGAMIVPDDNDYQMMKKQLLMTESR